MQSLPRREGLLEIANIVQNDEVLAENCEHNPYVDATLYLFALLDDDYRAKISKHLNLQELEDEVRHIIQSHKISRRRGDL